MSDSSSSSSTDSSSDDNKRCREINILLLGETGVGKSTFVNSLANYLSQKYFSEAKEKGLVKVIPTSYKVFDKYEREHDVKIEISNENDENECLETGESATQNVKSYSFPISGGRTNVRIIDTPGMGDTRGIEQDEKNFDNIMYYIKAVKKIHAICILLKPNNSRRTIHFEYCLHQILFRLEKEAAENIFFLFTNTRGNNYKPGSTLENLKSVISNIKEKNGVDISLDKNVYCFDNEGFRFLGACEKNIQFSESTKKNCIESWEHSAKTTWRLMKRLERDTKPYIPEKLWKVIFSFKLLYNFSKKIIAIKSEIKNIEEILSTQQNNLTVFKDDIVRLKNDVRQSVDVVETKKLHPQLICINCSEESILVNGVLKKHYKTVCHECTELNYSQLFSDIIGAPTTRLCSFINGGYCLSCKCTFQNHMHIGHTTNLLKSMKLDESTQQEIFDKESHIKQANKVSNKFQSAIVKLQNYYDVIKNCCLHLSGHLRENAFFCGINVCEEYVDYLITQKQYVDGSSSVKMSTEELNYFKDLYNLIDTIYKESLSSNYENFNFNEKDKIFEPVFNLDSIGTELRMMFQNEKELSIKKIKVGEYIHQHYYKREKSGRNRNDNNEELHSDDVNCVRNRGRHNRGRNFSNQPNRRGRGARGRSNFRGRERSASSGRQFGVQDSANNDKSNTCKYPPNFNDIPKERYSKNTSISESPNNSMTDLCHESKITKSTLMSPSVSRGSNVLDSNHQPDQRAKPKERSGIFQSHNYNENYYSAEERFRRTNNSRQFSRSTHKVRKESKDCVLL